MRLRGARARHHGTARAGAGAAAAARSGSSNGARVMVSVVVEVAGCLRGGLGGGEEWPVAAKPLTKRLQDGESTQQKTLRSGRFAEVAIVKKVVTKARQQWRGNRVHYFVFSSWACFSLPRLQQSPLRVSLRFVFERDHLNLDRISTFHRLCLSRARVCVSVCLCVCVCVCHVFVGCTLFFLGTTTNGRTSRVEYKPMEEGDEVLIDFDEDDFEEAEDFFATEGEGDDEDEEGLAEEVSGPVQVIGVEQAMDRVRELKKLGPPVPVKGERARSKRRVPVVAVIGRPNVGKSTVVNRLAKRFKDGSIVFDESGVTRDRTYKRAWYCGKDFDVVDTGGLVFDDRGGDVFAKEIRQQALIALEEATAVIMIVDGMAGCNVLDQEIARFLRQQKVPVILAVNKCESQKYGEVQTAEFWCLGLGEPWPISGLHGDGIYDMMDNVKDHLYDVDNSVEQEDNINVAIVGRPNVGKSSLLNRLFGETRSIVSDVPGTTRDSIDAMFERGGRTYRLVDTAGIRRKGKVDYGNEFFMVNRAFKAIRRADVVLLMVDVEAGITDQDRVLADRIQSDGRACVVVCNKWDLVENKNDASYNKAVEYAKQMLSPVKWAEVCFTSAKTGQRCTKLFDLVDEVAVQHRRRVKTSVLNEVLRDAVLWQAPPSKKSSGASQGKIYYCNQIATRPPTVAVFCNNPKLFGDNYKRYLDRKFREQLGMKSTPIRFLWRGKKLRRMEQDNRRNPKPYSDK